MKKIFQYAFAFIIGVMIWLVIIPYVTARRNDKLLVGGEILIPFYTTAGAAIFSNRHKLIAEIRNMKEDAKNEHRIND